MFALTFSQANHGDAAQQNKNTNLPKSRPRCRAIHRRELIISAPFAQSELFGPQPRRVWPSFFRLRRSGKPRSIGCPAAPSLDKQHRSSGPLQQSTASCCRTCCIFNARPGGFLPTSSARAAVLEPSNSSHSFMFQAQAILSCAPSCLNNPPAAPPPAANANRAPSIVSDFPPRRSSRPWTRPCPPSLDI